MRDFINLCDVCDFQGGAQPPKGQWTDKKTDGSIRMLQIRDFTQSERVKPEYVKSDLNIRTCCENDISIARYGASLGKILTGLAGAYNVAIMKACAVMENQARRWAARFGDTGYISLYEYIPNRKLRTCMFERMTEERLDFIVACRIGNAHGYDIVGGSMADDTIYNYVQGFERLGSGLQRIVEECYGASNVEGAQMLPPYIL